MKKTVRCERLLLLIAFALLFFLSCKSRNQKAPRAESSADLQKRLEQVYQANPGDAKAKEELVGFLQRQGVTLESQGQKDQAEGLYRQALALAPEKAHTHFLLGALLVKLQKYEEGIQELNTVIGLNPAHSDRIYELLGQAYAATGQADKAKDAYLKHLTLSPASLSSYRALAKLYRDQGLAQEVAQSETMAEEIARWGYPDRGYLEKSLEEWKQLAQPGGGHHGPGMESGRGEAVPAEVQIQEQGAVHSGPGAQRRALALYNMATYYDRAISKQDIRSFEKAMQSWGAYKSFSGGVPAEKAYGEIVKNRMKAIKLQKKGLLKAHGLMGVEEILGKTREIKQSLQQMPQVLRQLEQKTQGTEGEAWTKVVQLKTRLQAQDLAPYQRRAEEVMHDAVKLINLKLQGDSGLTADEITRQTKALDERGKGVYDDLAKAGYFEIEKGILRLAGEFQITISKHPGGGGEEAEE